MNNKELVTFLKERTRRYLLEGKVDPAMVPLAGFCCDERLPFAMSHNCQLYGHADPANDGKSRRFSVMFLLESKIPQPLLLEAFETVMRDYTVNKMRHYIGYGRVNKIVGPNRELAEYWVFTADRRFFDAEFHETDRANIANIIVFKLICALRDRFGVYFE